jgi:DNA-binding CsgD family transcriptional regulator
VPDAADPGPGTTVVVGVDGAGRTHRLGQLAAELGVAISRPTPATVHELLATGDPVVVDDAHRLDVAVLTALTDAAESGHRVVVARRPNLRPPQLAALDDALAARGEVELLPAPNADVDDGGLPGWAGGAEAVTARVERRIALLPPPGAQLVRVLSLELGLDGDALAAAARLDPADLAPALRATHDAGFTDATERLVPVVARAVRESLTPSEERALLDVAAAAITATGGDVVAAARRLRTAGARSAAAGAVYRAAGEHLRLTDPSAAVGWYDDAVDAGDDPAASAAGRAEAAVLLGEPVEAAGVGARDDTPAGPPGTDDATRLAIARGAAAAAEGRPGRAVEHLLAAGPTGAALAVALAWTAGRPQPQGADAASGAPAWLRRFAEAAPLAPNDPQAAMPALIEAAEALETAPPAVLPDTPHAVAAVLAVADADAATGERLLERAIAAGTGGPALGTRHRLLLAWVRLRAGRYDTATAAVRESPDALQPRDRLVRTALVAGLGRRSGDVAAMREAWPDVQDHLARRAVDLLTLELVEELAVTAARLRMRRNADALLGAVEAAIAAIGSPATLAVPLAWTRLQVAAVTDDEAEAGAAAAALAAVEDDVAGSPRHAALCAAGRHWAAILRGDVDETAVVDVASALAQAQLPWEASRLVGQAGVRATDPATARRLLERARDLSGVAGEGQQSEAPTGPAAAGLSEREVEVSRLVLAGRTHREIGAQLYIAPKTVEHHVARIRAKLGATTRAEFVASLRHVLAEAPPAL